jgi:hypothetical protein
MTSNMQCKLATRGLPYQRWLLNRACCHEKWNIKICLIARKTGIIHQSDRSKSDRLMTSFWEWGIYTPWPSPLRVVGSFYILSFPKHFCWLASSLQPLFVSCDKFRCKSWCWVERVIVCEHSVAWELVVNVKATREAFVTLGCEAS